MAVQVQVATLTKPTSGTDGATQDLNLNFTPKAIYVISAGNALNDTATANAEYSIGFSDGTNHACVAFCALDAQPITRNARDHRTDSVFYNLDSNALTLKNRASVAFATNKVTFTWDVMDTVANVNLIVLAIGGADITNVKVGTDSVGRTTTGTQNYTGLGFTPTDTDSILFTLGAFLQGNNGLATWASLSRGVATSTSKRWACGIVSEDNVTTSDTWRFYDNAACLKSLDDNGAIDFVADFSAWISDGFRLNYTDAPTTSTTKFSYMVIKGGTWDVGSLQSPTGATNDVNYAVSVNSRTLRGLLVDTVATATLTTAQTITTSSTGVTDGTNKACISIIDEDAQLDSDNYRLANTTRIIKPLTTNGATLELATFDSFTTNNFRLDWTTASAAQEYYGWVVVADSVTQVTQTKTHKYDVEPPPPPPISFKTSHFTIRSGTGTQDVTGLGFQPKALIIFLSKASINTYTSGLYHSYGYSDGTNDCSVAYSSNYNVATSATESNIYNDAIVQVVDPDGSTTYGRATLNAWLSDGFQLSWSVNTIGGLEAHYIAIGGTDITNVKVGTQSVGTTTTGNKAYTGVGFQGDFLQTVTSGVLPTGSAYTYNTTSEGHGGLQIGCAKSSTARFAVSAVSEDGRTPSDTWRYQRGDKCFAYLDNTTGTKLLEADFVSWDSDGWTWNYTTNTTANNQNAPFIYMAIKGGVWDVGYFPTPDIDTTIVVNTDASSTLRGVQVVSGISNLITSTTINSGAYMCISATDGTNKGYTQFWDADAANPTSNAGLIVDSSFMDHATDLLSGYAPSVSFGTSSFTITWIYDGGAARNAPYWALSEGPPLTQVTQTKTHKYDIQPPSQNFPVTITEPTINAPTELLTRAQTLRFTITDTPTITIDQTIDRVYGGIRTISDTPTITVGPGTLVSAIGKIRTITDTPTITVNQTISRIYGATRPITDAPSIAIDQTISRIQTILRQISETDVTVSDSTLASLIYIISVVESRIKWYYSLLTRKIPEGE